ncbi:chloroplast envelope quinone oxidoreductase homolog [Henckelia pumila]|uniref:chloroplast envelope quinone oxidoreductase homolog n=1 Tax=Henckelia pumila TaxID=405737 RepID=UPI003C6E0226
MAGKLMRALQYHSNGGGRVGLEHVEVPIPDPGKGQVLLKVEATSLNPVDANTHKLKLLLRPFLSRNPLIPATDVAGEVVEVGPNVRNFKAGDKVVAVLGFFTGGGLAEYCIAEENSTVLRPPQLSPAEAASLPVAGLTALLTLTDKFAGVKLDGDGPKKNILITAASGGVGHYAVQLAKLGNTHVTATCGARNLEFVKSLGADEVVDYKTPEGAALKSPSGKKYDVVIQCARVAFPWSVFEPNLSQNGKVIDITAGNIRAVWTILVQKVTFSKKKLVPLLLVPKGEDLKRLVELWKEGKIKTTLDSVHPLSKGEIAWSKLLDGHATGKIVVEQ